MVYAIRKRAWSLKSIKASRADGAWEGRGRGAMCRGASTASVWHRGRHVQAQHHNKMAAPGPPYTQRMFIMPNVKDTATGEATVTRATLAKEPNDRQ